MGLTVYDTNAAAALTGLAKQTLAKLRCQGGGPPFRKLGSKVVYPQGELEDWIARHPLQRSTADVHAIAPVRAVRANTSAAGSVR